eukprot:9739653-Alexandrium_andersonii.AAC.1
MQQDSSQRRTRVGGWRWSGGRPRLVAAWLPSPSALLSAAARSRFTAYPQTLSASWSQTWWRPGNSGERRPGVRPACAGSRR